MKQAKPLQPYRPWTVDEDRELVRLQEEGLPARDIAGLLDRSAGAIRSRVQTLARPAPTTAYARWTASDDARLRSMIAGGSDSAAIGDAMGRSRGAIHSRALRLGLVPAPRRL
ncbi:MAG: hypothetical protein EPO40_10600 [Myxococcaceae bacterium]|nr:MAG: hypothetical protein EPO40_10600 [Myxococcaceae bacterium]